MYNTRWLKAAILVLACMALADGKQAAAQFSSYNYITGCYDDPAGIAPPVCPNGPGGNAPPQRPKDNRPDTWGAIAVSPSTLSWGKSVKHASERAAQADALAQCGRYAPDCRIGISTYDYCMALAASPRQKIWAVGGPNHAVRDAAAVAVIHCQRAGGQACAVVTTACADG
jgi:hypothetical protein